MALWATELGAYDMRNIPRIAMKSQILAVFVVEFTVVTEEVEKESR